MARMMKLTPELCDNCIFMPAVRENGCSYLTLTGHSRIFENGKLAYDPKFCDKYEKGEIDTSYRDINIVSKIGKDEYWDYKCVKIRKEQSTYAYKNR